MIKLDDSVSYIKCSDNPLSSDIGIIQGKKHLWLFDTGNSLDVASDINQMGENPNIILSHFHLDHIGALSKIEHNKVYQSGYTYKHTKEGICLDTEMLIEDGVKLHLFALPSTHSKGCLALEVNDKYCFLGDAIYPKNVQGRKAYNVTLLRDEIRMLAPLKAEYFLLSHDTQFVWKKEDVLQVLADILAKCEPNQPYIFSS